MDEQKGNNSGPDSQLPSSQYDTERPYEEEVLGSELPDDTRTVSPDEEGPNTRGFQHGGWSYEPDEGNLAPTRQKQDEASGDQ